jgi:alpha-1,3-rhamnosyl/mannosyltransferase
MRVVLNRLTALRQKAGVGHYAAQLELTLRFQLEHADALIPFPGPWIERGLHLSNRLRPTRKSVAPAGAGRRLFSLAFRSFAAVRSFDLYHEPNTIPLPCRRPIVTTVQDLSPILHPEWHPRERALHFERHFEPGLAHSRHLITSTETIRRELIRHCGVAAEKITAIPFGIRAEFRPLSSAAVVPVLRRLHLPSQFFLVVGTLEPRKNLLMLMKAFCRLPARVRERAPLVLAGGWGWNNADLARFHDEHGRHHGVLHLGYVDDADLPALYSAALGLCFPSHYEGFGLPAVEMLACGGAVLASTAPALAELVGRKAKLIDPHDEDGWFEAMFRLATDPDWRRELRHGARQHVAELTWLRCARETWGVYRRALGIEDVSSPRRAA